MGIVQQSFQRLHYPVEIILLCFRWYLAYSLSLRNLEEMMLERGINVDHSTIHRWVLRLSPLLLKISKKHRTIYAGGTWYADETYIKVKGKWTYLYRAVNANGHTLDFMFSQHRDMKAALRFFKQAISQNASPHTINIDKSKANTAALVTLTQPNCFTFKMRQCQYKNNIIEQDHRFIKKRGRPMLGFKSFRTAQTIISGIEILHMLHKRQIPIRGSYQNAVVSFYSLFG